MGMIRFKFAPEKAMAALHWMVREKPGIDLHAALKACYFADKVHLNEFHRPIFGARYRAMKFGPVPVEIYEMAKGEAIWLAELGLDRFPWRLDGFKLRLEDNQPEDRRVFSASDVEVFEGALAKSLAMNFNDRTAATHGRDWQAAQLGWMKYEDMLDDTDDKPEIVEYLRENARFVRL